MRSWVRPGEISWTNSVANRCALSIYRWRKARVRWMLGVEGVSMTDRIAPVVAATNVNYRLPIVWPNDIVVELFVERLGNSSVTIGHRIVDQKNDSTLYSDGNVVVVWMDTQTGKSAPLPDAIRSAST